MEPEVRRNPFSMDEDCRNCDELCETRTQVVHGYGDVTADVLFVGERPSASADDAGLPFAGSDDGLLDVLERVGLCEPHTSGDPPLRNAYLTLLTRCRHPDRRPSDEELTHCEPFLDAELRMINPELIVPVGQRALEAVAAEYTTERVDALDVRECHGERIRGRGFELVPLADPTDDGTALDQWVEAFDAILESDYRQTKGRRRR